MFFGLLMSLDLTNSILQPVHPRAEARVAAADVTIELRGLSKRFGTAVAVDRLDLQVTTGSVFGLLGPNGAGKTTTVKMLTTLLPPTSGTAHVAGFDIERQPVDVRRSIGYVPQFISADGALTGYENLLVFAKLYGIPRAQCRPRAEEMLRYVGLADQGNMRVQKYSGGMIRRLEVALALLHQPPVLFLDEPTVGLDPRARQSVWAQILRLREELGMTVLMTTHHMEEADALCDQIAIMHRGRIVVAGSPDALKQGIAPDASLDDVFLHYTGDVMETEEPGDYKDAARARSKAQRLG